MGLFKTRCSTTAVRFIVEQAWNQTLYGIPFEIRCSRKSDSGKEKVGLCFHVMTLSSGPHGNGGPTRMRKKFNGPLVVPVDQVNGMAGELVVKTGVQSTRFVEACT